MTTDAHDTSDTTTGSPWRDWTELDAARCVVVPGAADDKYSRGVLGMVTGSAEFPGAAVLGAEAAVRTGLGMVRYLGPGRPSRLVLQARPEVVTMAGRVQAWLLGSGMDASTRSAAAAQLLDHALDDGAPLVVDAGALDLSDRISAPAVLTPHAGELVTLLKAYGTEVDRSAVAGHPEHWAAVAADATGHVVLLKGRLTHVCAPARNGRGRVAVRVEAPSSWAATAGSGDVLGGIVGAIVATNASALAELDDAGIAERLVALAATGAYVHAWAAERASDKGPIAALDIAHAVPRVIARLASGTRD
ncbi:ADP-dependent NAD(P)H-hydrate dehydratase [Herbiconiux ginsengi]|uniref:ADP-dependent (S)-NAD(P)H-hydrate dehydratase n=1 Tax=Herbiconiux ginsengi TaxID=381665 RepID=A0A1H3Q6J1_9MICO|nr:ADP/ATP-dependent (S)-NAD(P)H-hydrate dehydratase [Herbiconiux ginsengi]SDZ08319.1 NAD(P)H-hydrate repair enzyme Nnr, NAD(P)H-hydrate dehydratase domain [Herbiconiux ginsengi]